MFTYFKFAVATLLACYVSFACASLADWLNEPKWGPNPSEFAKTCVDFKGENLADYCQRRMHKHYDSTHMNQPTFPTWQLSCAQFDMYNCYLLNAKHYCSKGEDTQQIESYTRKFGDFLEHSIAGTIRFIGGQPSCGKGIHDAVSAYYNKTVEKQSHKLDFVRLPVADGVARECLRKLRTTSNGNLEGYCIKTALDRFDRDRRKLFESSVSESCCALYSAMDCLEEEANQHCSQPEHTALSVYRAKATIALGNSVCRAVPYNLATMFCHK